MDHGIHRRNHREEGRTRVRHSMYSTHNVLCDPLLQGESIWVSYVGTRDKWYLVI